MMILLLSLITLFNLHGRVLRVFGIRDIFYQPSALDVEVAEGKRVIEAARAMEERGRSRRFESPVAASQSKAREYLLQKYRGSGDSSRGLIQGEESSFDEGVLSLKSANDKIARMWRIVSRMV
jgi:hypothetical protein